MISIAVCDDELLYCSNMAKQIKDILAESGTEAVVHEFREGADLLRAAGSFDIIFLDIMMQGMDGMKTAALLREKAFDRILIFMSASKNYVFDAYDVEAFQYLVKPVEQKKLRAVLGKALKKLEDRSEEFIVIQQERVRRKILLQDILYFEIRGRVITVHGTEGIFDYYGQIGELEGKLQGKGFFRCHKSFLVNLRYVDNYGRQEIVLDTGERIAVAKRRYEAFCREFIEYMKNYGGVL